MVEDGAGLIAFHSERNKHGARQRVSLTIPIITTRVRNWAKLDKHAKVSTKFIFNAKIRQLSLWNVWQLDQSKIRKYHTHMIMQNDTDDNIQNNVKFFIVHHHAGGGGGDEMKGEIAWRYRTAGEGKAHGRRVSSGLKHWFRRQSGKTCSKSATNISVDLLVTISWKQPQICFAKIADRSH